MMLQNFSLILVTGGAGFIGSHIVDRLISEGYSVRVLDNLSTGDINNLARHKNSRQLQFIKGDIRNHETVKKAVDGVDAILHEAALVSVTRSIEEPSLSRAINLQGTTNLLQAASDSNVKRFIFASSCAIYGDSEALPNSENQTPKPLSPYAEHKLAAEQQAQKFYKENGLETVSLRYFNVYGPRQKHGPYSGVISNVINCLQNNQPPIIYGDGLQTRDFTNVKDITEANILALTAQGAAGKVFNIGTGKPTTINKLALTIQKIMEKTTLKPVYAEPRAGDIKHSYADITKAKKILGYSPKVQLEEGIRELIQSIAL